MITTLLSSVVENVGQVATSTVLTVVHSSHENTCTAVGSRALSAKTLDLSITINLVVLEHSQLGLLALVLDLLGSAVHLLLALLATSTEAKHEMKGGLLLDVVIRKGATVLELLAGKDQSLLVRGNALLILDFGFDIVDSVRRLHLEGDSLAR